MYSFGFGIQINQYFSADVGPIRPGAG